MCIALIGGMGRLERYYMEVADRAGVDLRVFTWSEANFRSKLMNMDALVIFTNKVSHRVEGAGDEGVEGKRHPRISCITPAGSAPLGNV